MTGWIKQHRKFVKWEWFTDVNTCHLFQYLLLEANHKETKWRGHIIMPGQLLTGRKKMALDTGLSERNVRTSLDKLKSTKEVTSRTFSKYSIITITNWNKYQCIDQQPTSSASSSASSNRPATDHIQELKEDKEEKNLIIDIDRFENFWDVYGYKVGRQDATKAYKKIIKQGVKHDDIISGVTRYQQDCQRRGVSGKFIKQPTTWLNGKHWQDEYPEYIEPRGNNAHDNVTKGIHLALAEINNQQEY